MVFFSLTTSSTSSTKSADGFKLRPSMVQSLQRVAIHDIYTCVGNYRTGPVFIEGTTHQPPPPADVAGLVEEMCDYINGKWSQPSPNSLGRLRHVACELDSSVRRR